MTLASGRNSKAICDRCCFKFDYQILKPDPNYKALRVCPECLDRKNPYLLPPIQPDPIALARPRPDVALYPFGNPLPRPGPSIVWGEPGVKWGDGHTWGEQ